MKRIPVKPTKIDRAFIQQFKAAESFEDIDRIWGRFLELDPIRPRLKAMEEVVILRQNHLLTGRK